MIDKNLAIGGVGTLALTTTVGVGVVYARGSGMPECSLLWLESGFNENYPAPTKKDEPSSIGLVMAWYLTGIYGEENNNKDWWEWSYERWKKDIDEGKVLSVEFNETSKVKFGYAAKDAEDTDGLNKYCEVIYKKDFDEILDWGAEEQNPLTKETELKLDLLRYCSPLGTRPLTIYKTQEQTYPQESKFYASDEGGSHYFISVTDPRNDLFWDLRTDEFFENKKKIGEPYSQLFKDLYEQKNNPNRGNLKEVCGEGYLKPDPSTNSDPTFRDLQMYCTIAGL